MQTHETPLGRTFSWVKAMRAKSNFKTTSTAGRADANIYFEKELDDDTGKLLPMHLPRRPANLHTPGDVACRSRRIAQRLKARRQALLLTDW